MTINDLHKVQKIDTEMLIFVTDICNRNGIEYFLLYGTLLGAVRHNGPIPWDDDVDIGMTRDNYNRLIQVIDKEIKNTNNTNRYAYKIMGSGNAETSTELKFYRKDTLYCISGAENLDIMNHVQLDVFVIDYLKEHTKIVHTFLVKIRNVLRVIKLNWSEKQLMIIYIKRSNHKFKRVYLFVLYFLHLFRYIFSEKAIEKFIIKMFVDKSSFSPVMAALGSAGCHIMKSRWFEEKDTISYDGKQFFVPKEYIDFLVWVYGDYLTYPPEDKRYRKDFDDIIFRFTS